MIHLQRLREQPPQDPDWSRSNPTLAACGEAVASFSEHGGGGDHMVFERAFFQHLVLEYSEDLCPKCAGILKSVLAQKERSTTRRVWL